MKDKHNEQTILERKIRLPLVGMFVLLCILVWLNELVDLPHLLLGAPPTPVNWREAVIEMVLIAIVGLLVVLRLTRDITERKWAEETLRQYHEHLEDLVEERTSELQQEISERKRAEEALEQKMRELETFLDNIPHMAWLKDLDSNFILVNHGVWRCCGNGSGVSQESYLRSLLWRRGSQEVQR